MTSHKRVIQPVVIIFQIQVVVVNQLKEVESGGLRLEGNGFKDLPEMIEVQPTELVNGVMKY